MTDALPQRWKLTIEYDGTPFAGWQRQQDGIISVQQTIEDAVHKMTGEEVRLHVAGRTDAGVHAMGQVAHFDLTRTSSADEIQGALNFHTKPLPVSILKVEAVDSDFHARMSAKARHYVYRIISRRAPLSLNRDRVWHVPFTLDVSAMQHAADTMLGHHDFSTFRAAECQANSPMRTLDKFQIEQMPDGELHCHVGARSFLHHQVRNMVGTLVEVGRGKWSQADFEKAFAAKDRSAGGPTAPACGLYFVRVDY